MVVFEVSDFKTQISNTPMTVFAERMAEFSRGKCREVEELRRERDSERQGKAAALKEVEALVKA